MPGLGSFLPRIFSFQPFSPPPPHAQTSCEVFCLVFPVLELVGVTSLFNIYEVNHEARVLLSVHVGCRVAPASLNVAPALQGSSPGSVIGTSRARASAGTPPTTYLISSKAQTSTEVPSFLSWLRVYHKATTNITTRTSNQQQRQQRVGCRKQQYEYLWCCAAVTPVQQWCMVRTYQTSASTSYLIAGSRYPNKATKRGDIELNGPTDSLVRTRVVFISYESTDCLQFDVSLSVSKP